MKRLAIAVSTVVLLGGAYLILKPTAIEYTAPVEVVVEKEVEVDALEKQIKHEQEQKKAEIEAIAKSAYDAAYNQEMTKVELKVISDFNKKLDARQVELEKETNLY